MQFLCKETTIRATQSKSTKIELENCELHSKTFQKNISPIGAHKSMTFLQWLAVSKQASA